MNRLSLKHQQGAESLEFVVVFPIFIALFMVIFEVGRALYTWNALTEATRRGARMAVVCPLDGASQAIVQNVAVFNTGGLPGNSPVVQGLAPAHITVNYFDANGVATAVPTLATFARVSINNNYNYNFIPGMRGIINGLLRGSMATSMTAPTFSTTLYMESKGAVPVYPGPGVVNPAPNCNFFP